MANFEFFGMFDYLTGDTDTYKYTSTEFSTFMNGLTGDGVSKNTLNEFATTASSLTLTIQSGACFIGGRFGINESSTTITLPASSGSITRTLVAECNISARTMGLTYIEGSTPTYTDTLKQIPLYRITQANNVLTLTDVRTFTYNSVEMNNQIAAMSAQFAGKSDVGHKHSGADITSGVVPITYGGTGATTAANARTNLGITPANIGAATSNHNHSGTYAPYTHYHSAANITSGVLPIARGGTGADNAPTALENLGIVFSSTEPAEYVIWLKPIT